MSVATALNVAGNVANIGGQDVMAAVLGVAERIRAATDVRNLSRL